MTETRAPRSRKQTAAAAGRAKRSSRRVLSDVLCAVDGSRGGMAAVRMAARLAGPDGHLTLLTVTAETGSGRLGSQAAISPSRVEGMLRRAKRIADDVGVASAGVVDHEGPPVKVILERARGHDLLALGAPATSRLGGMLVGGVADAALSQFTAPMLVVRRTFPGTLEGREILVASDGEKGSNELVKLAGTLGREQGARVTLVNALGPESKMSPHAIRTQARMLLDMLPEAAGVLVEPGKPWDVIVSAAKSSKAVLVILGSRRLGGLRALGSISRRVVHDAPCSVLLVPPKH